MGKFQDQVLIEFGQRSEDIKKHNIDIIYRFFFDTDVIVAAMRSPSGASAALLGAVLDRRLTMLASVPLFFEYEAKCTDPVHWTAAGMSREQADIFINGIAALVSPIKTHYLWRPILRDPNDGWFWKWLSMAGPMPS